MQYIVQCHALHYELFHILQSQRQLHWRQRSTGSGRESESQPLTTEPEVRAELCLSFSGESEGEEEGGGWGGITFHILKVFMAFNSSPVDQVHDCMIRG